MFGAKNLDLPGDGDPVLCKVRDLLRLFENYQSSKLLVWEIVRTMHPIHCASMLYIMENVMRTNKTDSYDTADDSQTADDCCVDSTTIGDDVSQSETVLRSFIDEDADGFSIGVESGDGGRYFEPDSESVPLCMRPTVGSKRCVVDRQVLPEAFDRRSAESETADGDLTLFGLVKLMQEQRGAAVEPKTFAERVVMHNLRTRHYTQFADNLSSHLLPDNPKMSRFSVGANGSSRGVCHTLADTGNFESLPVRFLKFYASFERDGNVTSPTERNSRAFRVTRRPKPRTMYVKPAALDLRNGRYYVQPRYVGYRVIVNVTGSETRTFNRFGEHVQNMLYKLKFAENVHATFEAVLLPVDAHGRLRSWRYRRPNAANVLFANSLRVIVVDVLRVHNRILVDEPFAERARYLQKLFANGNATNGESIDVVPAETARGPAAETLWSRVEREYLDSATTNSFEAFAPVNGLILRCASTTRASVDSDVLQYVFAPASIYSFRTNTVTRLHGRCSIREQFDTYFHVETAEARTTAIVYAHDEFHYYVCAYDRTTLEFVHYASLARIPKVTPEPRYNRSELIYVRDARKRPAGVAFVRVYHNENDKLIAYPGSPNRVILGYDQKLTTSMYDLPYKPTKWYGEPAVPDLSNPALLC